MLAASASALSPTSNDPSTAWINMEPHWLLIEVLLQGTYGIRKKHRTYLPQEPREELDEAYDNRLLRSVLSPYYVRLERMLAGMLTRKPVSSPTFQIRSSSICSTLICRATTSTFGLTKQLGNAFATGMLACW